MEYLDTLRSEHRLVDGLFRDIEKAEKPDEKEKLYAGLASNLKPHMKGEETYFYPALKEAVEDPEDVLEAVEEHHGVHMFVHELDKMSPQDERWQAKLTVMKEMIKHHVLEEESKIFARGRSSLTGRQLDKIAAQYEALKKRRVGGNNARK